MVSRLALLFVVVPLVELYLLIQLGGVIGLLPTLGLCVLTGVAGAWLARREGLRALWSLQARLAKGELPGRAALDGLFILVGAALLLTPGLLTDVAGFALILAPSRRWLQARVGRRLERMIVKGSVVRVTTVGDASAPGTSASGWSSSPVSRPAAGEIIQEGGREER